MSMDVLEREFRQPPEVELPAEASPHRGHPSDWGDRIAARVLSIFCCKQSAGSGGCCPVYTDAWARRLVSTWLGDLSVQAALSAWATGLAQGLESFYDYPSPPVAVLQARLLRALRGASALDLLQNVLRAGCDTKETESLLPPAQALLEEHVQEIASNVSSLEMEGFNMAVRPSLRPQVPPTHTWWLARPPPPLLRADTLLLRPLQSERCLHSEWSAQRCKWNCDLAHRRAQRRISSGNLQSRGVRTSTPPQTARNDSSDATRSPSFM